MRQSAFTLALILVGWIASTPGLSAQGRTAAVSGTVTDAQSAALPGALVELTGASPGRQVTSGVDGSFEFAGVEPGSYTLVATLPGFAPLRRAILVADAPVRLSLTLTVAPRSEHVVVTAQKREQALADVGMSITAIAGDVLAYGGVETTPDLAARVPGLTYATGPYGVPVYTLRGLGNDDNQSPQQAPTVGIYADEILLPFSIMTRGVQSDLERVEILKGPQGTLYGLSTTGGAINYIARKPTRVFEAGVALDAARFGRYSVEGFLSGPLSRTLAVRVSLKTDGGGAWQRSASRGETMGNEDRTSARAQVLWSPSARVDARVTYAGWSDRGDPLAGQIVGASIQNPTSPARARLLQTRPTATSSRAADWPAGLDFGLDQVSHSAAAHLNWRAGDVVLTSNTGFVSFTRLDLQPGGPGDVQNVDVHARGRMEAFSQELRLARTRPGLSWIAGLHYAASDVREHETAFVETNSVTEFTTTLDVNTFFIDGSQQTDSAGMFGHVEWTPARDWTLTLGARYTDDRKDFSACTGDNGPGSGLAAVLNANFRTTVFQQGQCTNIGANLLPARYHGSLDESDVSGRVGLDWKPGPAWLVYGNVSRGFKAGAFPILSANTQAQFEPVSGERVLAYESGVKTTIGDGAAQIAGAVFYYDYVDKQIRGSLIDPIFRVLSRLVNVPRSRVAGADAEVTLRPREGLSMQVSGAWLSTRVLEFVGYDRQGRLQDFAGAAFPLAPATELTARLDYSRPLTSRLTGVAGVDASYTGRTQGTADFVGLPEFRIDAYTLLNARVGIVSRDGWRVTAWARNLTNEYYWINAQRMGDFNIRWAGRPRTVGMTLGYEWR